MFYKRKLPVIKNSFGTNDNVFINLDGINPSLKMIIPLFHENELINRIGDISLYYSNEYDFDNSPFGRNIMISHIKVLSSIVKTNVNTIEYATITFEDGKEVVFERDLTYASYENQTKDILINDDTDYYIVVEYDVYDNPKSITSLELFDKNGN